MKLLKSSLLGSAAAFAAVGAAHAADLPVKKAVPIEYVRVCSAYGAGFFYIPGTDTCLRLSGRARFEGGYMTSYSRQFGTAATPRATRAACASTSMPAPRPPTAPCAPSCASMPAPAPAIPASAPPAPSSASARPSRPRHRSVRPRPAVRERRQGVHPVRRPDRRSRVLVLRLLRPRFRVRRRHRRLGHRLDQPARLHRHPRQRPVSHDLGRRPGLPPHARSSRRPTTPAASRVNAAIANFAQTNSPAPVFIGYTGATPTRFSHVDVIQRERMPDFVGALRLDQAWGSAQVSAAVHELNVGNVPERRRHRAPARTSASRTPTTPMATRCRAA